MTARGKRSSTETTRQNFVSKGIEKNVLGKVFSNTNPQAPQTHVDGQRTLSTAPVSPEPAGAVVPVNAKKKAGRPTLRSTKSGTMADNLKASVEHHEKRPTVTDSKKGVNKLQRPDPPVTRSCATNSGITSPTTSSSSDAALVSGTLRLNIQKKAHFREQGGHHNVAGAPGPKAKQHLSMKQQSWKRHDEEPHNLQAALSASSNQQQGTGALAKPKKTTPKTSVGKSSRAQLHEQTPQQVPVPADEEGDYFHDRPPSVSSFGDAVVQTRSRKKVKEPKSQEETKKKTKREVEQTAKPRPTVTTAKPTEGKKRTKRKPTTVVEIIEISDDDDEAVSPRSQHRRGHQLYGGVHHQHPNTSTSNVAGGRGLVQNGFKPPSHRSPTIPTTTEGWKRRGGSESTRSMGKQVSSFESLDDEGMPHRQDSSGSYSAGSSSTGFRGRRQHAHVDLEQEPSRGTRSTSGRKKEQQGINVVGSRDSPRTPTASSASRQQQQKTIDGKYHLTHRERTMLLQPQVAPFHGWLNDEIINAFLYCLVQKYNASTKGAESGKQFIAVTSHLLAKLRAVEARHSQGGGGNDFERYRSLCRWLKHVPVGQYLHSPQKKKKVRDDCEASTTATQCTLLIPIHSQAKNHWSLLVIELHQNEQVPSTMQQQQQRTPRSHVRQVGLRRRSASTGSGSNSSSGGGGVKMSAVVHQPPRIVFCDSLRESPPTKDIESIQNLLCCAAATSRQEYIDELTPRTRIQWSPPTTVRGSQANGYDCGVFTCFYAADVMQRGGVSGVLDVSQDGTVKHPPSLNSMHLRGAIWNELLAHAE